MVPAAERDELAAYAGRLPAMQISERASCDLQLLACGAFSPLDRFVGKQDYQRILAEMRLSDGQVFPIPVILPVSSEAEIHLDQEVAIRNSKNELLAILTVEEAYPWDLEETSEKVFGTQDRSTLSCQRCSAGENSI